MYAVRILLGFLHLTALSVAGPLRRDHQRQYMARDAPYQNTTTTQTSTILPVIINPLPFVSSVSLETLASTTLAVTTLVPVSVSSTASQSSISALTVQSTSDRFSLATTATSSGSSRASTLAQITSESSSAITAASSRSSRATTSILTTSRTSSSVLTTVYSSSSTGSASILTISKISSSATTTASSSLIRASTSILINSTIPSSASSSSPSALTMVTVSNTFRSTRIDVTPSKETSAATSSNLINSITTLHMSSSTTLAAPTVHSAQNTSGTTQSSFGIIRTSVTSNTQSRPDSKSAISTSTSYINWPSANHTSLPLTTNGLPPQSLVSVTYLSGETSTRSIVSGSTQHSLGTTSSASPSREFPLVATTSVGLQTQGTVSVVPIAVSTASLVTDTFSPISSAIPSSISAEQSTITPVSTSVIGTSSSGAYLSIAGFTSMLPASSTANTPLTTISRAPTTLPLPSASATTIGADIRASNLAQAKNYNALFGTLNASSPCTTGQIACINGETANCGNNGLYVLASCAELSKCFALPMTNVAGVSVGCADEGQADAILGLLNTLSVTIATTKSPTKDHTTTSVSEQRTESPPAELSKTSEPTTVSSTTVKSYTVPVMLPTESVSGTIAAEPESTTTVKHTSTAVIYITQSVMQASLTVPASALAPMSPSQTVAVLETTSRNRSPTADTTITEGTIATTRTGPNAQLITIVPVRSSALGFITVTVTTTTTEKEVVTTTQLI